MPSSTTNGLRGARNFRMNLRWALMGTESNLITAHRDDSGSCPMLRALAPSSHPITRAAWLWRQLDPGMNDG